MDTLTQEDIKKLYRDRDEERAMELGGADLLALLRVAEAAKQAVEDAKAKLSETQQAYADALAEKLGITVGTIVTQSHSRRTARYRVVSWAYTGVASISTRATKIRKDGADGVTDWIGSFWEKED